MRWLKSDRGISMVLVGVLLVVLLGLAGIAIDVGALFAERRELRNGADAAALAVAEDCGRGYRPCDDDTALASAQQYADANSRDGGSGVDSVDLVLTEAGSGSVRVVTSAWDEAAGEAGVRVPLLSLLGFHRVTVRGAATAIFDFPASGEGLPVIIGQCEFDQAAGYGPSHTITLFLHAPSSQDPAPVECPSDPAHKDFPGGFGMLEPNVGTQCLAAVIEASWYPADPGASLPQPECKDGNALEAAILNQDILVPVYSDMNAKDKLYLIYGFAAFHVSAYNLGGPKFTRPSGFKCEGGESNICLQGWFTETSIYHGTPGGPNLGVVLVKLTE